MPLFSKNSENELVLILDVQSSIVRGSTVLMNGASDPRVIFTYNAIIPYKPHIDSSYLIKMTLRAITETIDAAHRDLRIRVGHDGREHLPRKISEVHYALSSPWIVSQAKTISTTFPTSRHVTRSYILGLIAEERTKVVPDPSEPIRVIEEKIFDVRLNGYSVRAWEGKETRSLDVSFAISIAGTRMVERFIQACEHIVRERNVFFHSSLLLQHIGIHVIFTGRDTYSLIHAHGELTDLVIVKDQVCAFFGSYPFGIRTLVRAIASSTGTNDQSADSMLTLYVAGHLDQPTKERFAPVIQKCSDAWLSGLRKLFEEAGYAGSAPDIAIMAALAHDDLFINIFKSAYPKVSIDLLSIDDIVAHVGFETHTERRRLTGLHAVAIHTARQS